MWEEAGGWRTAAWEWLPGLFLYGGISQAGWAPSGTFPCQGGWQETPSWCNAAKYGLEHTDVCFTARATKEVCYNNAREQKPAACNGAEFLSSCSLVPPSIFSTVPAAPRNSEAFCNPLLSLCYSIICTSRCLYSSHKESKHPMDLKQNKKTNKQKPNSLNLHDKEQATIPLSLASVWISGRFCLQKGWNEFHRSYYHLHRANSTQSEAWFKKTKNKTKQTLPLSHRCNGCKAIISSVDKLIFKSLSREKFKIFLKGERLLKNHFAFLPLSPGPHARTLLAQRM